MGDIFNVGVIVYYYIFFEMFGNFLFGDYFKKEVIYWVWEFLIGIDWFVLDVDWLSVSVYEDDDEVYNIWCEGVGLLLE